MANNRNRTGPASDAKRARKSRAKAAADGLRPKTKGRRRNVDPRHQFEAALRSTMTSDIQQSIFDNAPEMGPDALNAVSRLVWSTIAGISAVHKQYVDALRANAKALLDFEDADRLVVELDLANQELEAYERYMTRVERMVAQQISGVRLFVDRDMNDQDGDFEVGMDNWTDGAREELRKMLAEATSGQAPQLH